MASDHCCHFESSGLSEPKLSTNARPCISLGDQNTANHHLDEAIKFRNKNKHDPLKSENKLVAEKEKEAQRGQNGI